VPEPLPVVAPPALEPVKEVVIAKKKPLGPVVAGDLVLVGAGDIADCSTNDDDKTAVLVERVLGKSEKAWAFTLGDNVYPDGTQEEFYRCYEPTWGRFKSRTIPVVGNHDWRTANAGGFRGTFARRFTADGPLWFSVDVEGTGSDGLPARWHVVVLDSNCDKIGCAVGSPQYNWLLADLKKNATTKCTVAMFHHPRFSSGPHGDAEAMVPMWAALDKGGVDLVLAGHDHTYERFAALNSEGNVVAGRGIPSVVVGTGGKSHYPIISARKHSAAVGDDFGVLQVQLDNDGWHSRFIAVGGAESDLSNGTCR
jgi:alkaline phosphatase